MLNKLTCGALLVCAGFLSCNPDCELVAGLRIEPPFARGGDQVVIKAEPPSSLFDKKIYFDDTEVDAFASTEMGGVIVTVPKSLFGKVEVKISDVDCQQTTVFEVVDEGFFSHNPTYIPPSPPEIIIPVTPNLPYPPSIDNAWLSPNNTGYCIWFTMVRHVQSNGDTVFTNTIDPTQSVEQRTPCNPDSTVFYNKNPIFGIIDSTHNVVNFWIDRTGIGLGVEEFEGKFVHKDNLPAAYLGWEPLCGTVTGIPEKYKARCHFMLVTSKETGRQLLIYQQGLGAPRDEMECY